MKNSIAIMEALSKVLSELRTDSRELLQRCEEAISKALVSGEVRPSQAALLVASNFTNSHVDSWYPSLCLVDILLQKASTSGEPTPAVLATRVFLKELLPLFADREAALLESFPTVLTRKTTRDKAKRLVNRWLQGEGVIATVLPSEDEAGRAVCIHALEVVRKKVEGTWSPEEESAPAGVEGERVDSEEAMKPTAAASAAGSEASEKVEPRSAATNPPSAFQWTKAEVSAFRTLLQESVALLKELPEEEAQTFTRMVLQEHRHVLQTPSPHSFTLVQSIRTTLRQAVAAHAPPPPSGEKPEEGKGEDTKAPQSGSERRERLTELLSTLYGGSSSSGPSGAVGEDSASDRLWRGRTIAYTSPLLGDVNLRLSLTQRSGFVGPLLKNPRVARGSGVNGSYYYPKSAGLGAQASPFRIPSTMLQQAEGGRAVRLQFPSVAAWEEASDTGELALFDCQVREGGSLVSGRKRQRELQEAAAESL